MGSSHEYNVENGLVIRYNYNKYIISFFINDELTVNYTTYSNYKHFLQYHKFKKCNLCKNTVILTNIKEYLFNLIEETNSKYSYNNMSFWSNYIQPFIINDSIALDIIKDLKQFIFKIKYKNL